MKELKAGDVVIAPNGCESYLTAGKEYLVIEATKEIIEIFDDEGDVLYLCLKGSAHLNGGNWIVK